MRRLPVLVAAAACLVFAATAVSGAAFASSRPFTGAWWAIDLDGSLQHVTFGPRGTLVYSDSYASVCAQAVPGLQSYVGWLRDRGTIAGGVWMGGGEAMFRCPAAKYENGPHLMKFMVTDGGMLRGGFGGDPNGMYWYTWTRERPVNPFTGEWGAIDPVDGPISLGFGLGGSMQLTDPRSTACGRIPGSTSGTGLITWDAATNTYTWTGDDLLWVCQTTPPGPFDPFTLEFVFHDGAMMGGWPGQYWYAWTRT